MNALIAVRSNAAGLMSPTQAQRSAVKAQLNQAVAPRVNVARATPTEAATQTAVAGFSTDEVTRNVQTELGRDAFLQLLVLQLQNQDPMDPIGNEAMLAQLAQFAALEQMEKLNQKFEFLSGNFDQLNFISASQLVGKTVKGVDLDGQPHEGIVRGVHLNGSVVILDVDGTLMSMAGVGEILENPVPDAGGGLE